MDERGRPAYDELVDWMKSHPWVDIYFFVSGGRDSSALLLEAWKRGIRGVIVFQETMLERATGRKMLKQLTDLTEYPLEIIRYNGNNVPKNILRDSFMQLLDVLPKLRRVGYDKKLTYDKSKFTCCDILKKRPMKVWFKNRQMDKDSIVLVMGIKGADGSTHRRIHMAQIRNQDTFFRLQANGFRYYYPLRDMGDKMVRGILEEHGFDDIRPSGCVMCPVFCIFPAMIQRDRVAWLRSVTFARKLGIPMSRVHKQLHEAACAGGHE